MLRELISDLRRLPPLDRAETDMARLLRTAAGTASLPRLLRRPGGYSRTCVFADDRFEVLLLDWSAGAASAIHDHGGQHCWLVVARGRLRVDDFERIDAGDVPGRARLSSRGSRVLESGGMDLRSRAFDVHRVSADEHAVSLHVYAAPLRGFLVYDERAGRCSAAAGTYDDRWPSLSPAVAR